MSFFKKFANLFKNNTRNKTAKKNKVNNSPVVYSTDLSTIAKQFKMRFEDQYFNETCFKNHYPDLNNIKNENFIFDLKFKFNKLNGLGYDVLLFGKTYFVRAKSSTKEVTKKTGKDLLPEDLPDAILSYACEKLRKQGIKQSNITEEQLKESLNSVITDMREKNMAQELYDGDRYVKGHDFEVGNNSNYFKIDISLFKIM